MELVFSETPLFTRLLGDYLTDERYRELQRALMGSPETGELMPGTGGFRKVRLGNARRGRRKRGGLRVIFSKVPGPRAVAEASVSAVMTVAIGRRRGG